NPILLYISPSLGACLALSYESFCYWHQLYLRPTREAKIPDLRLRPFLDRSRLQINKSKVSWHCTAIQFRAWDKERKRLLQMRLSVGKLGRWVSFSWTVLIQSGIIS